MRGAKTACAFAPKTIPPLDTVQNRLGMSTKTPRPAEKKKNSANIAKIVDCRFSVCYSHTCKGEQKNRIGCVPWRSRVSRVNLEN